VFARTKEFTSLPVEEPPFDLLCVPVIGRFLTWRHSRTALAIPALVIAVAMIVHGLFGPTLAPKNLATTISWVHFRGALVLALLCAGNLFCLACPFMLVRQWARRWIHPRFAWPRALRNKWLSTALFAGILFVYELFDLWSSPWWTAWLIVGYFAAILAIDSIFKHAAFCKFVCPIGQFNFVASTLSPLEVKVRDQAVCVPCHTKDCIRGRRDTSGLVTIQRGCELALFQPAKSGNMDCTFCLECVQACPHDNVGMLSRPPASELMSDPRRSGIGVFSRRPDLAALAVVFTFGALLNAFGMVSPVYVLESWMAGAMHVSHEAPVLGTIFVFALVIEPLLLLAAAAWLTRTWGGSRRALLPLMVRYAYALVPLGFGMWLAHYSFHFLTGLLTLIPVVQNAVSPLLGPPFWRLTGIPVRFVQPLEFGFLALGLVGSLMVAHRLAEDEPGAPPARAFLPWAAVCVLLFAAAVWLILQPMEMRATFMG
jgi:polyferredoxin